MFPTGQRKHGTSTNSDHSPLLVEWEGPLKENIRPKHFRFESFWTKERNCADIIKHHWNHALTSQPYSLSHRLDELQDAPSRWKQATFRNLPKKIKQAAKYDYKKQGREEEMKVKIRDAKVSLVKFLSIQEQYWCSRARSQWLIKMGRF